MNADGSNFVRLTTNEVQDSHPDWSPNGQKIVFGREGISGGLLSINPDGSGEKRLILDPFAFGVPSPSWSRDGQQLAYQTPTRPQDHRCQRGERGDGAEHELHRRLRFEVRSMRTTILAVVSVLTFTAPVRATCSGDCSGDGTVTVNELVLGVNIALSAVALSECASFDVDGDGAVAINELIAAVNSALNGCTGFAGHYRSTVTLDGGRSGTMDLTVESDGAASGELVISDGATASARDSGGAAAVIANVSLSGSVNLSTGQFSIAGSYVDAQGSTVPINVGGTLPFTVGGAGTVTFEIGANSFTGSIVAAPASTPTPTATSSPGPGTTHFVKVGQPNLPFDPELLVINPGGHGHVDVGERPALRALRTELLSADLPSRRAV